MEIKKLVWKCVYWCGKLVYQYTNLYTKIENSILIYTYEIHRWKYALSDYNI